MYLTITIQRCKNSNSNFNSGLAKGLRRKLIFAILDPDRWIGLFLGIIPVWGLIDKETADTDARSDIWFFEPAKVRIKLFEKFS